MRALITIIRSNSNPRISNIFDRLEPMVNIVYISSFRKRRERVMINPRIKIVARPTRIKTASNICLILKKNTFLIIDFRIELGSCWLGAGRQSRFNRGGWGGEAVSEGAYVCFCLFYLFHN